VPTNIVGPRSIIDRKKHSNLKEKFVFLIVWGAIKKGKSVRSDKSLLLSFSKPRLVRFIRTENNGIRDGKIGRHGVGGKYCSDM